MSGIDFVFYLTQRRPRQPSCWFLSLFLVSLIVVFVYSYLLLVSLVSSCVLFPCIFIHRCLHSSLTSSPSLSCFRSWWLFFCMYRRLLFLIVVVLTSGTLSDRVAFATVGRSDFQATRYLSRIVRASTEPHTEAVRQPSLLLLRSVCHRDIEYHILCRINTSHSRHCK